MTGGPAAFMSYARFDDVHDDGQLSEFRRRLSAEIRMQTGREFPIFQDREDIAWGQNWRQRIEQAVDGATLLLVIVTPGLFQSTFCRDEIARFREREQKLGRADLILPVYYVSTGEFDNPDQRDADETARLLWSRQYADWRELRFEPLTSPTVRRTIAQLATRMRDAFWRRGENPAPGAAEASDPASNDDIRAVEGEPPIETAKTEPPTHVVDISQHGDFVSVAAAIAAADPGDRILVRPGLYEESLLVDKPLEIIGDGPVQDIEIRAHGEHVLTFRATIGRIANLTLQTTRGAWGVMISQGRLDLDGCDISSRGGSCVYITGGADPRLRRNKIHDAKEAGVFVYNNGLGTLEDNEIRGNGSWGAVIRVGGNSVLRRNQICDNVRVGVEVYDDGLGVFEDNEISGNGYVGMEIRNGGNPTVRCNRINRNAHQAVFIHDGGKGVFEDNDLTSNTRGAWLVQRACEPNVTRARNTE